MEKTRRPLLYIIPVVLIVIYLFLRKDCEECKDCTPDAYLEMPDKIIPVNQAKDMYDNYTYRVDVLREVFRNPQEAPNDALPSDFEPFEYNPTRYIEYSLDEIKHYIAYLENESKKAGIEPQGLRIFLGAYPGEAFEHTDAQVSYPHQESIFMTPTAMNNGRPETYFIRNGAPVFISQLGDEIYEIDGTKIANSGAQKGALFSFMDGDDISLTLNDGNAFPPPHGDTDFDK